MKLQNKHTGEVVEVNGNQAYIHCGNIAITFTSLEDLNKHWEDWDGEEFCI